MCYLCLNPYIIGHEHHPASQTTEDVANQSRSPICDEVGTDIDTNDLERGRTKPSGAPPFDPRQQR
jgi:hypothetical protein